MDRASNNSYYLKNSRVKNSFVPSTNNNNLSSKRCKSGQCINKNNIHHHSKHVKNDSNKTSENTAPLGFKVTSQKSVSSSTTVKVTKSKGNSIGSQNSRKRGEKRIYCISDVKPIDTLPVHFESQIYSSKKEEKLEHSVSDVKFIDVPPIHFESQISSNEEREKRNFASDLKFPEMSKDFETQISSNKEKEKQKHLASDIKFSEMLPKDFESLKHSRKKEQPQKHSASGGKFTRANFVQFALRPTRNVNKNFNSNQSAVDVKDTFPPKQYSKSFPLEIVLSHQENFHKSKNEVRKQIEQFKKSNRKSLYFNTTSTKPLNHKIELTVPISSRDAGVSPTETYSNSVSMKYEQSPTIKKSKLILEDGRSSVCSIIPLENASEIFNNFRGKNSSLFPEAANKPVEESCSMDVEMEDISDDHNVPCLEDFFEPMQLDESNSSSNTKYYYIVVDTNILISDLKFVNMLKDASFTEIGPAMIYIPWVVLQELDRLKQNSNGKENSNLGFKASQAIRFLYSLLKAKHPQICGQTAKMAAECSESSSMCNDDQILMCCLKLAEKVSKEQVMLLTNDKNLNNKALISDVTVNTVQSLKKMLAGDNAKNTSEVLQLSSLTKSENFLDFTKEINDIIEETKIFLKFVLEYLLVLRMNETFGSKWKNSVVIQPPWSLTDVILCIKQHWVTSFSGILAQNLLNHIEIICCESKEAKGLQHLQSIIAVITALGAVCQEFQNRYTEFSRILKEAFVLKCRCENWCKTISNPTQRQSVDAPKTYSESTNHHESIISVFEYLWNVINSLCGLILDCHGFQHNVVYTKPVPLPKKSDINLLIPELYSNIYELWKRMRSALDDPLVVNEKNITSLYNCLVKFVPSLRIDLSPPPFENFSECSLKAFFLDKKNRMLLENGYVQLRNFHTALRVCVTNVVPQCNQILSVDT